MDKPHPFKKTTQKQIFNGIALEKIHRTRAYREQWGYSAYECSFLLGKHDFFVRDAENPLESTHFNVIDTNYLQLVFNEPLSTFTPPVVEEDTYHLKVTKYLNEVRLWVWEIQKRKSRTERDEMLSQQGKKIKDIYEQFGTVIEENKLVELPTSLNVVPFDTVQGYIDLLLFEGFFDEPKTALDILKRCREHFGDDFHARNMIRVINHYTNKKSGIPLLDNNRTNEFGRRIFFKPYNFDIISGGEVSKSFLKKGIDDFVHATKFVQELPYRRNEDKNDPSAVLSEKCGTCSTKHALLKRLANENGHPKLKLMLGIFRMGGRNTPTTGSILEKYGLKYLPEAHNYLKVNGYILDFTGLGMTGAKLEASLLTEIEITPDQITDFKVGFHRDYLATWLADEGLSYSLDEIWRIREECIREIARKQCELDTDRLTMRPFRAEDGAMMYALNEDPEVLQYTGDAQFADVDAATIFLRDYDQYEKYGVGRLVVILKETGEALGWCGLKYHPDAGEYDIGYRFFKKHWGKGYATESAKAAMEYGFGILKLDRIIGRARVENPASINVFNKLGMRFVEPYIEHGQNWVLYEAVREI